MPDDSIPITIYGDIDQRAVEQLERCARAGDAVAAAICADGHVGYSQPIGGVIAYPEHVSPSGVGFDIGCIAAGERVLTADGSHVAIVDLGPGHEPVRPGVDGMLEPVSPYLGLAARGPKIVVAVRLADGRVVSMTPDHQVRTTRGWRRADALGPDDVLLCPAYRGLPHEPCELSGAFLRLAGYLNGDGHIARSRKYATIYTAEVADLAEIVADIAKISGYDAPTYVRTRPNGSTEASVRINKRTLIKQLIDFGCPIGRKLDGWGAALLDNLLALPPWARAQYLAGFAGAEGATPAYAGRPVNLVIKQRGREAMAVVTELMASLRFDWAVYERDDMYTGQLQGGATEQVRFIAEVGFAYARNKRRAAATVTSLAVTAESIRGSRAAARTKMRVLRDRGMRVRHAAAVVAYETGLTPATCAHLLYRDGILRVPRRWTAEARTLGECAWIPVCDVSTAGTRETYDVVTADPAQSFLAGGITVHNCGNKAVRTDLLAADLRPSLPKVMDEVFSRISFGVGRVNDEPVDHPVLERIREAEFAPQRRLHDLAAEQLGTVGAGNHYVDVFEDEDGHVWVGVHFGSRGFGHRTASGFLALAEGRAFGSRPPQGEMDSPPVLLPADSELGQSYIAAMQLAGEYAYAGRDVVVDKVLQILGARSTHEVHNHHNFAWRERHLGTDAWVVRKGCTPAFPGQESFVGATMGEPSVVLRGRESAGTEALLKSTVHGAGRVMSRRQANKQLDYRAIRDRIARSGIEVRGGAADEAPEAYKRLDDVLAAHADTVEVVHRLRPLGVAMAAPRTIDPYKD